MLVRPFRSFEEEALRLLAVPILGAKTVEAIIAEAKLVRYEYSGAGYFVTVRHPVLPTARTVISKPIVIGTAGNIEGGYIVFVENRELMLECYSAGGVEVPENFRDLHVHVAAT